jgi:hypothetical protein
MLCLITKKITNRSLSLVTTLASATVGAVAIQTLEETGKQHDAGDETQ